VAKTVANAGETVVDHAKTKTIRNCNLPKERRGVGALEEHGFICLADRDDVLKGHGYIHAATPADVLKGHGFIRAAKPLRISAALAAEGRFWGLRNNR
jgi:hypothetical protein